MSSRRVGVLIAIEGIDGAGKSTLQRALARRFRRKGWPVTEMVEPSRGRSGARARRASAGDPWSAALAFTKDRRRMRPRLDAALTAGRVVLQDRSFYSTLAYQGSALPPGQRRELERLQRNVARAPDRVLWLDLPLAEAAGRRSDRGAGRDPTEARAVLRRATAAYRRLARRPGWIRLDARRDPERLADEAYRALSPCISRRLGSGRRGA